MGWPAVQAAASGYIYLRSMARSLSTPSSLSLPTAFLSELVCNTRLADLCQGTIMLSKMLLVLAAIAGAVHTTASPVSPTANEAAIAPRAESHRVQVD